MKSATIEAEVVTDAEAKQPLILRGTGYGLEIAPSYQDRKAEVLRHSALIVTITDSTADDAAANQLKALATMRIEVEKSREVVKRPALDFGKKVDATAKEFVAEIAAEEDRLKKARGTFAEAVLAERQRVLREMEAARLAEAERVRKEEAAEAARIEAERVAAEAAEKARIAAEEAAFNAVTPEEEAEAKRIADEAKRVADEAAAQERARVFAAQVEADRKASEVIAPVFVPEAPKGVKMVADFELENIDELYCFEPGLVRLEPKRAEILEKIKRHTVGDVLPKIPGLRVFMKPYVR